MTEHVKPKREAELPARIPIFVSRGTGAAALDMSPATWDTYVREGKLPKPTIWAGKNPRWLWSEIMLFLTGQSIDHAPQAVETPIETPRKPFFGEATFAPAKKRKLASAQKRPLRHQAERAEILLLPSQPGQGSAG